MKQKKIELYFYNSDDRYTHTQTLQMNQTQMNTTPKEELMAIMFEAFEFIEQLEIPEGQYLQIANMFKRMNGASNRINVERIERFSAIRTIIVQNQYYQDRQRRETVAEVARRNKIEEADKVKDPHYGLCSCGKYIKFYTNSGNKSFIKNHYKTIGHHRGYRVRKLGGKNIRDDDLKELIDREIVIQGWIVKHTLKVREIQEKYNKQTEIKRERQRIIQDWAIKHTLRVAELRIEEESEEEEEELCFYNTESEEEEEDEYEDAYEEETESEATYAVESEEEEEEEEEELCFYKK
jgi:hypothetical protein